MHIQNMSIHRMTLMHQIYADMHQISDMPHTEHVSADTHCL